MAECSDLIDNMVMGKVSTMSYLHTQVFLLIQKSFVHNLLWLLSLKNELDNFPAKNLGK